MAAIRLIARLDIKGSNVIKGIHLEGLRVVGTPGALSRKYYAQGIDEIIFMDTVASLYGRNNIIPVIEEAARDVFVPITVGGGMRSVDDIVNALRAGADKIAINTGAIARPAFIKEAAEAFGSQCIVLSVEAKRRGPGRWEALTDNGRERTGVDVLAWVSEAERLGAGEIMITSVDTEGTKRGFDHELFQAVRERVHVPLIGCGGAGDTSHLVAAAADGLDAIACASLLHYDIALVTTIKASLVAAGVKVRFEAEA